MPITVTSTGEAVKGDRPPTLNVPRPGVDQLGSALPAMNEVGI